MNIIDQMEKIDELTPKQRLILDITMKSNSGLKLCDIFPRYYNGKQNAQNAIDKLVLLGLAKYDETNGLTYIQPIIEATTNTSH